MAFSLSGLFKRKRGYDPRQPERYFGKGFTTKKGSYYSIERYGHINKYGRVLEKHIRGAKVGLVAGVEDNMDLYADFAKYINMQARGKRGLDRLILKHGQKVKPGFRLVISLSREHTKIINRCGFITSPIVKIMVDPSIEILPPHI